MNIYIYIYIYICVCVLHDVCFCFSDWVAGFACHSSELAADVHLPWKNHGRKTMMFPCPCCRSMVSIGFLPFLVLFGPAFWGPKEPFVGPRRAVGSAVSWDPSAESPQSLAPGDG